MGIFFKKLPKVYVSLTGWNYSSFLNKLKEIKELKITEACVFLTTVPIEKHKDFFNELLNSNLKYIPLVHLRRENTKEDIEFFKKNFKTKYFNIHDEALENIERLNPHLNNILLENKPGQKIDEKGLQKIRGFCIDISHYYVSCVEGYEEYNQIIKYKNNRKMFVCNHLSGASRGEAGHNIQNDKDYDYLKDIPNFIIGEFIAIELMDPIKDQLRMKRIAEDIIKKKF